MSKKQTKKAPKKTAVKKEVKPKVIAKVNDEIIDDNASYSFESNGLCRSMPKGEIYSVKGSVLKVFLSRKYGKKI